MVLWSCLTNCCVRPKERSHLDIDGDHISCHAMLLRSITARNTSIRCFRVSLDKFINYANRRVSLIDGPLALLVQSTDLSLSLPFSLFLFARNRATIGTLNPIWLYRICSSVQERWRNAYWTMPLVSPLAKWHNLVRRSPSVVRQPLSSQSQSISLIGFDAAEFYFSIAKKSNDYCARATDVWVHFYYCYYWPVSWFISTELCFISTT